MAGGRVLPPYASPRAPCQRTRREAIDEDRLAVASRRRARAVVQGARLRKRRTTVFASRVAQVVRVPRVVFSTVVVVGVIRAAEVGDVGVGMARLWRRRRRQGVMALSVGIWDWVANVCAPKVALIWSPAVLG